MYLKIRDKIILLSKSQHVMKIGGHFLTFQNQPNGQKNHPVLVIQDQFKNMIARCQLDPQVPFTVGRAFTVVKEGGQGDVQVSAYHGDFFKLNNNWFYWDHSSSGTYFQLTHNDRVNISYTQEYLIGKDNMVIFNMDEILSSQEKLALKSDQNQDSKNG